jgi:hypothetical protein
MHATGEYSGWFTGTLPIREGGTEPEPIERVSAIRVGIHQYHVSVI